MKISNKTYDILKVLSQVILPFIASIVAGLGEIWGMPYSVEIGATVMLFDGALGTMLEVLSKQYHKEKEIK